MGVCWANSHYLVGSNDNLATIICKGLVFGNIEAIIFDKDGTLENSQNFLLELAKARIAEIEARLPGTASALTRILGIKHDTIDPAGLMAVGSRQENEIAAASFIAETGCSWFAAKQLSSEAFITASRLVVRDANSAPLFAGSLPVLKNFAKAKIKLGILSADSTSGVQDFIARSQLSDYIQLAMGVDGEIQKPDPRLFVKACQAMYVSPYNALMVGDSLGDMAMAAAAQAAGKIGISRNNHIALANADVVISSLSEIQILDSPN